jgi:hypothetical protein
VIRILLWVAATAVLAGIIIGVLYAVMLAVAWIFLQPYQGILVILSEGVCT